jgi:hypothetical protein
MRTRLAPALVASVSVLALVAACGDEDPTADDLGPTPSTTATTSATGPSASGSATPTTSPTPTPTEVPPPATTRLSVEGLVQGAPPALPLVSSPGGRGPWTLQPVAGESVDLQVDQPFGFATLGDRTVVLQDDGDGASVAVLGADGRVAGDDEEVLGYRLAVSANGSMVAWLAADRAVRVVETGREASLDLPRVPGAVEIGALAGYDTCLEAESDVGGCTAYVDVDEPRQAWLTTSHGIVDVAGPLLAVADSAPDGDVIGLVSVADEGSCGGLFAEPDAATWETCAHTLTAFSPSGRLVLGTDAYLDGFGRRSVAFLDAADGAVLQEFAGKGRGPTILQTAWEDDEHVLAVVFERGRWAVVRLGVDGSAELAVEPVAGSDFERPFFLPEE